MPDVSIIVPVYNSEKYLKGCLESILAQTFEDFEVIVIDDGSSDVSLDIARKYEASFSRIKVIQNSRNEGAAVARNRGLDVATGKYVCFVDSDDIIHRNMLKTMYTEAEAVEADVVQCGYSARLVDEPKIRYKGKSYPSERAVVDFLEFRGINGYIGGKFIRRRTIGSCRLPSALRVGEDGVFLFEVLSMSSIIRCIDIPLYCYREREDSLSNKGGFSVKIFDNFVQADMINEICLEKGIHARYARAFSFVLYYRIFNDLIIYGKKLTYEKQYIVVKRKMRDTWKSAFVWGKLTTKIKCILSIVLMGGMKKR